MALAAGALALRLTTLPSAPDIDDSVLFVRGVIRFSVKEMRPHWPGYPVYIWAGKLFAALVGDPVLALHLLSAFCSVLCAAPIAFIARAWARSLGAAPAEVETSGWVAAALWLMTPMAWVTGSQIISDALGLLLAALVLTLAIVGEASERRTALAWTAAAVVAGVMIGARLVNVTMLGPLLWKAWVDRRRRWWGCPPIVMLTAGLAAGMAPWAAWLATYDVVQYVHAAEYHLTGHFTRWGASVATDPHPRLRPFTALRTFVLFGLGAGAPSLGWARVVSAAAWIAMGVLALRQRWRSRVGLLVGLWFVPDFVYLFFGHDISFPRYLMPAVLVAALAGGIAVARRPRPGLAAAALAVLSMGVVSHHLALSRRDHPLVEYSAVQFLTRQPHAAIGVIDIPTLSFYLSSVEPNLAFANTTPAALGKWLDKWAAERRQVFLTEPPSDPTGWQPVAHFCLDPLVDPRPPHELWLFSREPVADAQALRGCEGL